MQREEQRACHFCQQLIQVVRPHRENVDVQEFKGSVSPCLTMAVLASAGISARDRAVHPQLRWLGGMGFSPAVAGPSDSQPPHRDPGLFRVCCSNARKGAALCNGPLYTGISDTSCLAWRPAFLHVGAEARYGLREWSRQSRVSRSLQEQRPRLFC